MLVYVFGTMEILLLTEMLGLEKMSAAWRYCIGDKGDFDNRAPVIGDNVDMGVGAKIIGPVTLADNLKIGANAVVTKSCETPSAVLVGVPAKAIK